MTNFKKYWLISLIATLAVTFYPLYMGLRVVCDVIATGAVPVENFPKYVIPYAPIALSLLFAVIVMPWLFRKTEKFAGLIGSLCALGVFFATELVLENQVMVTTSGYTTVEGWQMSLCYVPPDMYLSRTWKAIDVLIGEFTPAFKLHFYLISVILIIAIINCIYGFGKIIRTGDRSRQKALSVQSVCTALFLGLCILACFTAFYRNGELTVSPLSASLMGLFFVLMGVTAGIFAASFLLGRRKLVCVFIPAFCTAFISLAMYIGEMILLSGHLYKLGSGILFESIPYIVLAPIDLVIILLSGVITGGICALLNKTK